ncbi:MAG TPA: hypothetical protein PKA54_01085 [Chitinophagaceae bacterium]|nr:hypothetical protein [Chitinophagaceae bacterium]
MRILIILLFVLPLRIDATIKLLHDNWIFKNQDGETWLKAKVPGTIHTDLLENKIIEDPFWRDNEKELQWVSTLDWEYKTAFQLSYKELNSKKIILQFDGIDTYADVYLNGEKILEANNMFRTYKIDVKNKIKSQNILHLVFHSIEKVADSLAAQRPLKLPCENNRNMVRKAQYHFGWDWTPHLVPCGVWRSVKLLLDEEDKESVAAYSPVKLIQQNDSIGQSFYFTVNGKPTYMKGANWVPADVFLPRITKEKYRDLLIAAKEAHFNMLRVWGGGIYESDDFYDLCDSLEIYVWQDFMFAGAIYPADKNSLENIKQEAIDNILRLRKHPCIVLWCGNNEIDEAWNNWGWQKQFKINGRDSLILWNEYHKIFNELLPSLVAQYDSGRAYIPSTPLYGWGRAKSMTHGDSHYWGMWWGRQPINIMKEKVPRFASEFGMQALPNIESYPNFLLPQDYHIQSNALKVHQKFKNGYEIIEEYLNSESIPYQDFESFVAASQELQCKAIEVSLNAQLHSNAYCMGSLWWQLNDCWPACSWSLIDYYGNKKKGYYMIRKMFEPNK